MNEADWQAPVQSTFGTPNSVTNHGGRALHLLFGGAPSQANPERRRRKSHIPTHRQQHTGRGSMPGVTGRTGRARNLIPYGGQEIRGVYAWEAEIQCIRQALDWVPVENCR